MKLPQATQVLLNMTHHAVDQPIPRYHCASDPQPTLAESRIPPAASTPPLYTALLAFNHHPNSPPSWLGLEMVKNSREISSLKIAKTKKKRLLV